MHVLVRNNLMDNLYGTIQLLNEDMFIFAL